MQITRFLAGLTVLAFAVPALAEGPAHKKPKLPAVVTTPAAGLSSAFEASVALVAAEQPAKAEESRLPVKARHVAAKCPIGSSCSYRKMFAYLVITRDIQVPGAPDMAVRLLPTKHALAGDSQSTIVVRPRVKGGHYGLDVAARF